MLSGLSRNAPQVTDIEEIRRILKIQDFGGRISQIQDLNGRIFEDSSFCSLPEFSVALTVGRASA